MFKNIPENIDVYQGEGWDESCLEFVHSSDVNRSKSYSAGRRMEFLMARSLATKAVRKYVPEFQSLDIGLRGEPIWPNDIAGSISHSKGEVMVVVSKEYKSLGVDMEQIGRIKDALYYKLFSDFELKQIQNNPHLDLATIFFSAKEAFYKMQYPRTGEYLDFLDIELTLSSDSLTYKYTDKCKTFSRITNVHPIYFEQEKGRVITLSIG